MGTPRSLVVSLLWLVGLDCLTGHLGVSSHVPQTNPIPDRLTGTEQAIILCAGSAQGTPGSVLSTRAKDGGGTGNNSTQPHPSGRGKGAPFIRAMKVIETYPGGVCGLMGKRDINQILSQMCSYKP